MREFGSEFLIEHFSDGFFKRLEKSKKNHMYLQSGREGLLFIARELVNSSKQILMPSYCCESMVLPFLKLGWSVIYYPLDNGFKCNMNFIRKNLSLLKYKSSILVMNYFGLTNNISLVSYIRKERSDINIIEDFTQNLFNFLNNDLLDADYYVASIRKWLGITDGAIVLTDRRFTEEVDYRLTDFITERKYAQEAKNEYSVTKEGSMKSVFRKKLGRAEMLLNNKFDYDGISKESLELLHCVNGRNIAFVRSNNFLHLYNLIRKCKKITFPFEGRNIYKFSPMFMLPIMVKNRDVIQASLSREGLYCQVLWPLTSKKQKRNIFASNMENSMLAIPIDQRYDFDDIEDMADIIFSIL